MNRLRNQNVSGCSQAVEQQLCIALNGKHGMMSGCQELFVAHICEELQEEIIEAADVEKPDGLRCMPS
jgi:hypothetical protein